MHPTLQLQQLSQFAAAEVSLETNVFTPDCSNRDCRLTLVLCFCVYVHAQEPAASNTYCGDVFAFGCITLCLLKGKVISVDGSFVVS